MKPIFRITLLSMVMLCVAAASFAGMKKCFKKAPNVAHRLSVVQAAPDRGTGQLPSSTKEFCAPSLVLAEKQQEEPVIRQNVKRAYVVPAFSFHLQQYSDPPFAPPRKQVHPNRQCFL